MSGKTPAHPTASQGWETGIRRGKVIRMTWQPAPGTDASTLQTRVIPAKGKTTIAFHHEWLKDANEKAGMNAYWKNVLDKIGETGA